MLLGWQGATVNNHLTQVQAGCELTPLAASQQDGLPIPQSAGLTMELIPQSVSIFSFFKQYKHGAERPLGTMDLVLPQEAQEADCGVTPIVSPAC